MTWTVCADRFADSPLAIVGTLGLQGAMSSRVSASVEGGNGVALTRGEDDERLRLDVPRSLPRPERALAPQQREVLALQLQQDLHLLAKGPPGLHAMPRVLASKHHLDAVRTAIRHHVDDHAFITQAVQRAEDVGQPAHATSIRRFSRRRLRTPGYGLQARHAATPTSEKLTTQGG